MTLSSARERNPLARDLPPGSRIADPSARRRNDAMTLSLVCALLWPICLVTPILIMSLQHSPQLPDWVGTLTGLGLFVAPTIGIPAGIVGLYRALRRSAPRATWWLSLIGLVCCLGWLAALFAL